MSMFDSLKDSLDLSPSTLDLANQIAVEFSPPPIAYSYSDTQFEILKRYIQAFEASLDQDHEVGIMLNNFGQSVTMVVSEIGYEESVLMVFKGLVNGMPATLIQHVSQLSFLLTSVPRQPDVPKRKIGFSLPQADEE